jgi:hypothetical protein
MFSRLVSDHHHVIHLHSKYTVGSIREYWLPVSSTEISSPASSFTVCSMPVTFHVNGAPVRFAVLDRCAFFGGLEQSVCSTPYVISRYALE